MIISPEFTEQSNIAPGKLVESIQAYQREQQTGLVTLESARMPVQLLLFARGQLVTAYRGEDKIERLDPAVWLDSLDGSGPQTMLRTLALTPQDVRIFKILIEQQDAPQAVSTGDMGLEDQLAEWMKVPAPALAQVRWPRAEALLMYPGGGAAADYNLFITADQVLHSARDTKKLPGWEEAYQSASLFGSEARTLAWTEYMLHRAFSGLVPGLFGKFEKLVGRLTLNQVIREVNFKATAHDWNVSVNAGSVNDQTIFASPAATAEVYARLLEIIFHDIESVVGNAMLQMLVREAVHRLPAASREVIKEHLTVAEMGA